jgi:hypothetical protein
MSPSQTQPTHPGLPRQAVVLIHGIGEQRPMDTLRGFVAAFLDMGTYHSKPDTLSDSYELRRFKLRRAKASEGAPEDVNLDWPETDFYEYYWAHQMYGTTLSHVVTWLLRTLWLGLRIVRLAPADYRRLTRLVLVAWGLTLIAVGVVGAAAWWLWTNRADAAAAPAAGAGALVLFLLFIFQRALKVVPKWVLGAVLDFAGDAARYLDVNPKNVARRYDILRGGIALLKKLHEDRDERGDDVMYRYGRIVLVGHSLGSVIAYDILRHYWGEVNGRIDVSNIDVSEVEAFSCATSGPPPDDAKPYSDAHRFRQSQCQLWKNISDRVPAGKRLRRDDLWRRRASDEVDAMTPAGEHSPPDWQPARWLVSDLVTLGSPLAHAPVLLACGTGELKSKVGLRELPICPPDRSRNLRPGHFVVDLSAESERLDAYKILHHGACFALTRWTNFWYPNDPVGGPLRAPFGFGIEDVQLPNASRWPVASHVRYWQPGQGVEWSRLKDILTGAHGRLFCPLAQTDSPAAPDNVRAAAN